MPRRDDTSLASLLLSQRLVDVGAAPLKASEYWRVRSAVEDLASLLGQSAGEVETRLGDADLAERVGALLDGARAVAVELENLEQSGVAIITPTDETYPQRLLERLRVGAPPILYVAGPTDLLSTPALGIVGSRSVDADGADIARGAARQAVSRGYTVVSGGAKGVDQLAMQAAFEAGGRVVGVLAENLLRRLRDADTRSAVLDGLACLCTPFKPSAGFSVANAMGRNKVVYGLSEATLVVASDLKKGGTWAGAHEAIRNRTCDVVIWTGAGAGEGNEKLAAEGGRPIADLEDLFPLASVERETPDEAKADQLTLEI
jgi:predicted Rossmann fold nucleotide-binding protein DprA/Smf involved in DNA uptake